MPYAFSQIPDGYGSGRGYGRGMGGRMMAGRGFGNALYHLFLALKI
jgi:E3 ubiquitin-protein ligase RBBP6